MLPVVFPDGTEAELVYPEELDIARLGVQPYSSGELQGKSPNSLRGDAVGRDFWIFHGELADVLVEVNNGHTPRRLAEYRGADGRAVGLWEIRDDFPHLGFQFGAWAVLVYDYTDAGAMTDAERASWAASFSGHEAGDGFLLLEGSGPLRLARAGEHAGPALELGNPGGTGFTLFPGSCRRQTDRSAGFASWCLSPLMDVHATGSDAFVGALLRELEVKDVRLSHRQAE